LLNHTIKLIYELANKKIILFSCVVVFCLTLKAQNISLNGEWSFTIDPMQKGEAFGWHQPWKVKESDTVLLVDGFDKVTVPHTYTLDARYNIIGKAWYRKAFRLPSAAADKQIRLHFEAVFNKAGIYVNGVLVAMHEGGYTPFTIDITKYIKTAAINFLSVEVDNSWDAFTIPGSKIGVANNASVFPWYEFGGITRDVSLLITDKVFISNQKIEAKPDLHSGTANIQFFTWIENKTQTDKTVRLQFNITNRKTGALVSAVNHNSNIVVKAFSKQLVATEYRMNKADVLLWDYDNPNLYNIETTVLKDDVALHRYETYFGIREVKVAGTQLLLNGHPIRVAGANRPSDHPVYGSSDPAELANTDMSLLRNGNMIFSRLSHTPLSRHFYQWADEHGYLIIAEITNWQLPVVQMENQRIRDAVQLQMKELVESFWNSPSIIAYSTGNEYASWTPEGDEWTRYQMENFKKYDTTRLLTFVAIGTATSPTNLSLAHNSFRYCDFLNFNNYSGKEGLIKNLENLHQAFPDKPIFISEVGVRADEVKEEAERVKHLENVIDVVQSHDYAIGFAYWSFNDYLSRYTGTNKNGYRPWGIVDANRNPRELYKAFQKKLSPVTVQTAKNKVIITGNAKFPSYTISNYHLKIIQPDKTVITLPLPTIEPQQTVAIKADKLLPDSKIRIENKEGIVVYSNE